MTNRLANVLLLLFILGVGAGYLFYSSLIAERRLGDNLGPIVFPVAIGAGIVLLALVEIGRTLLARDDEAGAPFPLPNAGKLAGTLLLIAAHFGVWQRFDLFYPATFALFVALVLLFRATLAPREIGIAALWAGTFTLVLYLVFQVAFGIGLG
jgi:hypothetical protein